MDQREPLPRPGHADVGESPQDKTPRARRSSSGGSNKYRAGLGESSFTVKAKTARKATKKTAMRR